MAEENSVKNTLDSSLQAVGKVARFAAENVLLPIVTGGTSFLATKLPKAVKALDFLRSAKPQEKEKDNTTKFVLIGIGVFFFLPIMAAITITTGFADFVGLKQISTPPEILDKVITAPLQCQNTRHKAEEIICWLKNNCVNKIGIITKDNWREAKECLRAYPSPNINNLLEQFENSIGLSGVGAGKLQCVGFVKGIEALANHDMEMCGVGAKDYWGTDCPKNYKKYTITENTKASELKSGDIVVRTKGTYGHMGIVIETVGNKKIVIAQANGGEGRINLVDNEVNNYDGFLRYK